MASGVLGVPRGYKTGSYSLRCGPMRPGTGRMRTSASSDYSHNPWFSAWSSMGPPAVPRNLLDIDSTPPNPELYGKVRDPAAGSG